MYFPQPLTTKPCIQIFDKVFDAIRKLNFALGLKLLGICSISNSTLHLVLFLLALLPDERGLLTHVALLEHGGRGNNGAPTGMRLLLRGKETREASRS